VSLKNLKESFQNRDFNQNENINFDHGNLSSSYQIQFTDSDDMNLA